MVKKQRLTALLLLLSLSLSGCGQVPTPGREDSSRPPARSEGEAHSAATPESTPPAPPEEGEQPPQEELPDETLVEVQDEVLYLDDPDSIYPLAVERWPMDLDGDGQEEQVELWAEKAYWGSETDNDWHEGDGMRPYSLRLTRGEETTLYPLSRQPEDEPAQRPYYWSAHPVWTRDQDGGAVLVLAMENMSAGGAGSIDLYAFSVGAEIAPLPVPERYTLVTDQSDLYALLTIPETGYREELDLAQWMAQRQVEPLYDERGEELQWPVAPQMLDGFYSAREMEEGIELRQYGWGVAHVDGMCDLVTHLSWRGGQAVVLQQYFDWYD